MNVTVENLPNCMATMKVELPPERVSKAWEAITREFTQIAKIPGYRPGKAPKKLIETKYKKEIREELTRKLLSESCREAIAEKQLKVLSLGEIEDVEIKDDKSMHYTATLVTTPTFELPEYKGIEVKVSPEEVTDAEVNDSIENLRNQVADFKNIEDRALQMEDYAVIDYTGTIDGKPVHEAFPKAGKPLSGNNDFWIRMTAESFFPGFCENLVGLKEGESRSFEVEVPADFPVEGMAGQKIQYSATVKGIREKVLPELNDEFAAKIVPGKTVAELRDLAKQELSHQKKANLDRDRKNQIMAHLLAKVECELPANLVRQETKRILNDIVKENQERGVTDEVLKESEKQLIGVASQNARDRLKGTFVLLQIADAEKISVTKEEFQQRIDLLAARYSLSKEKMMQALEERGVVDQIHEEILTAKVLDFLSVNATSVEVPAEAQTA